MRCPLLERKMVRGERARVSELTLKVISLPRTPTARTYGPSRQTSHLSVLSIYIFLHFRSPARAGRRPSSLTSTRPQWRLTRASRAPGPCASLQTAPTSTPATSPEVRSRHREACLRIFPLRGLSRAPGGAAGGEGERAGGGVRAALERDGHRHQY